VWTGAVAFMILGGLLAFLLVRPGGSKLKRSVAPAPAVSEPAGHEQPD